VGLLSIEQFCINHNMSLEYRDITEYSQSEYRISMSWTNRTKVPGSELVRDLLISHTNYAQQTFNYVHKRNVAEVYRCSAYM